MYFYIFQLADLFFIFANLKNLMPYNNIGHVFHFLNA